MIKYINARLRDNRGITLVAVLMVMAILLSIIGAGLLFSGINTKISGNYQVGTKAFYAADTGINAALGQIAESTDASIALIPVTSLGSGLGYRSGHRTTVAQAQVYKGTVDKSGYKLNQGSGYNGSGGYTYQQYQLNMTGIYTTAAGTEVAGREVEAQAVYGPVRK